jgi:hypothetical protein
MLMGAGKTRQILVIPGYGIAPLAALLVFFIVTNRRFEAAVCDCGSRILTAVS